MRKCTLLAVLLGAALCAPNLAHADYNGVTGQFTAGKDPLASSQLNDAIGRKCNADASLCTVTPSGGTSALSNADREATRDTVLNHLSAGQTAAQARDGSIDITSALAAALAGSQEVGIPCGTYRLNGLLPTITRNGTVIKGAGRSCVTVLIYSTSGNVITVGSGGSNTVGVEGFQISGIKFYAAATRTSGAVISLNVTYAATIRDVDMAGPIYDGITVIGNSGTGQAINRIEDFVLANAGRACIRVTGGAVDTFVSRGNFQGCNKGMLVDDANGLYADHLDAFNSGSYAYHFTPSASANQSVQHLWMTAMLGDTSASHNWVFDGDGKIADIHCLACWASSSAGGSGFYLSNATLDQASFDGGTTATNNSQHGFAIAAGSNITLNNVVAEMNSMAGSGQYDGIVVTSAPDWVTVTTSRSGQGGSIPQNTGHANWQRYGLNLGSGTDNVRHLTIMGNQYRQNVTGGSQVPSGTSIVNLGNTQ